MSLPFLIEECLAFEISVELVGEFYGYVLQDLLYDHGLKSNSGQSASVFSVERLAGALSRL